MHLKTGTGKAKFVAQLGNFRDEEMKLQKWMLKISYVILVKFRQQLSVEAVDEYAYWVSFYLQETYDWKLGDMLGTCITVLDNLLFCNLCVEMFWIGGQCTS